MPKIPATIVTGFLGSGKTSLIQHLLKAADGRRIALIINEFGDQGVDGDLVKDCGIEGCDAADLIELANGCICCTVADDFLPVMKKLLARATPVDHIVIETSGLALPKPLIQAFNWPDVRNRVTVDGVVAVVDAAATAAGLFADDPGALDAARRADPSLDHEGPLEELFEEQLGAADLVLLNKLDLVDAAGEAAARAAVAAHARSSVRMVGCRHGKVDPKVVLGLDAAAEDDLASRPSHHDGSDEHDHDDFESFLVDLPVQPSPEALARRVEAMAAAHAGVLRVKGFAAVADRPMRLAVQAVGDRVATYFDRAAAPAAGCLVVIGLKGLDQRAIAAALKDDAVQAA